MSLVEAFEGLDRGFSRHLDLSDSLHKDLKKSNVASKPSIDHYTSGLEDTRQRVITCGIFLVLDFIMHVIVERIRNAKLIILTK